MSEIEIIKQEPYTLSEVKTELEQIQKKKKELNYRSTKVQEYINLFPVCKTEDVKTAKQEILGLEIGRLKEKQIAKLLDILPETEEEIKITLSGENITVKPEDARRIAEVIKKYKWLDQHTNGNKRRERNRTGLPA